MSDALLVARGVSAGYHGHPIVHDLDIEVLPGQVVVLLGPNGAGKTTTLLTLAGDLPHLGGEILLLGEVTKAPLHRRAKAGLSFVTEERSVFMRLSVADNLRVGRVDTSYALAVFPELRPLMRRRAGLLSGGEQQMLSLARALARRPKLLLIDELSLGLAPLVVARLLDAVQRAAHDDGVGVLLVEQHIKQALRVADEVLAMQRGEIVLRGPTKEVRGRLQDLEAAYLSARAESAAVPVAGNGADSPA